MPIVPSFQGGVPQVRDNGGSGAARFDAPVRPFDYSSVLQDAMRPADSFSKSLTEALRITHERTVKAESDDAERQVMDIINTSLHDPENGFMIQQGKNAMDAFTPTMEKMTSDIDAVVGSLQPQVREAVGSRLRDRLSAAVQQAQGWASRQTQKYHFDSSKARVDALYKDAAMHYADIGYLQSSWASINDELDYQANLLGSSPEVVKQIKDASFSLFQSERYTAWSQDDPVSAFAHFTRNSAGIDPDVRGKLDAQLFSKSRDLLAIQLAAAPTHFLSDETFKAKDLTGEFNTQLTPEEEKAFQAWAKSTGRLGDLFDYDLRGEWKELQSGAESENGRLSDKYKKPNHPTFSEQSQYSSESERGGRWTVENGHDVFTPGREVSQAEANFLHQYFTQREPGVELRLKVKDSEGKRVASWIDDPLASTGDAFIDSLPASQRAAVVLKARQLRTTRSSSMRDGFTDDVANNLAQAAMGENPQPLALSQFVEVYGGKEGQKRFDKYRIDFQESQAKWDFRMMSDGDIDATLAGMKPRSSSPTYSAEAKGYESLVRAAASVRKSRREDKIGYAIANGAPGYQPLNFTDSSSIIPQLSFRARNLEAMQRNWGGAPQVLSKDESTALVSALNSSNVDDRVRLLSSVADGLGPQGLAALTNQLKDTESFYAIAASAMTEFPEGGTTSVGAMCLRGMDAIEQKRVRVDDTPELGITAQVSNAIGADDEAEALFDDPQVVAATVQLAKGVYGYELLNGGTINDAIRKSVGNIEVYNGKKIVVPSGFGGWFEDDVEDVVQARAKSLAKSKESFSVGAASYSAQQFAHELPSLKLQTYERLPGGGVGYLVLRSGLPVMNAKTGEPFILEIGE